MALGTSTLSLSQIRTEFGGGSGSNSNLDLQDYYRGGSFPAGLVGVCSASARVAQLIRGKYIGHRISNSIGSVAKISPDLHAISTMAGVTTLLTPNTGNNDDGFWSITIPWTINYLGVGYTVVCPTTNNYFCFGQGSTAYSGLSESNPAIPKIMWGAGDRSAQRIHHGVEGASGSRVYKIQIEGSTGTSGTVGSPTMIAQFIFYEAFPSQIDFIIAQNGICDGANLPTPAGALVPSGNTANNPIPINGTITMQNFQGTGTPSVTSNTFNMGTLTFSAWETYTNSIPSGKSTTYEYFDYSGWRTAGYDISDYRSGGTGALGSGTAGGFSMSGAGYNVRALYTWYQQFSGGVQNHVIVISSSSNYPSTNIAKLTSHTFPYKNPSNTSQTIYPSININGNGSATNFTYNGEFCTKFTMAGPYQASTYRHNGSTAYSLSITYLV
jgi:hypothetical protein